MNNYAHLKKSSVFYPLFENGMVPIKNILIPSTGNMIGGGGVQEFYDVDLDKIDPETKRKLFQHIANQCGSKPEDVEAGIAAQPGGRLPLRAIHVESVSSDSRAFL